MAMTRAIDTRPTERIDCDLVIVGGGASGVATATIAARNGLKVVLAERYGFCGGGAVAGHSGTMCGLYEATEDNKARPNQVIFGFADEYVKLLESRNGLGPPVKYGKTYTRVHDPLVWREASDSLLKQAGVTVIYHAVATQVIMEGKEALEGVRLWTKQGPLDVYAKMTVVNGHFF